jgi:hypothetical protein
MNRNVLRQAPMALLAVLTLVLSAPVAADTFFSWETEEGTPSFTDDPKRIPAQYRAVAKERPRSDLRRYSRTSVVAPDRDRRLARAGDLRGAIAVASPGLPGTGSDEAAFMIRTSGSSQGVATQVGFPVSSGPMEPIVTDNVRVMPADSEATRHITIVRQGGRVLSVVRPQLNQTSATFESEADAVK